MISASIRNRYLADGLPTQLGGLAADLARIASFADNPLNHDAVASLLEEAKHFAEWAAPVAPPDIQAVLAEIQLLMALWQRRWLAGRPEPLMREEARRRSEELLALSGLV